MKSIVSVILITSVTVWLASCIEEKPIACTKELRSFSITVNGAMLDDYYTIRVSNGDTIRRGYDYGGGGNVYWVLDDRMNRTLEGKTENFRFEGIINGNLVVNELYMFRGGPCHLGKVFGKNEVDI